jgi:hypothetical protein
VINLTGDGNLYVSTDSSEDKLFAYQGTGRDYTANAPAANQAMYFVPPLNCATKGDVDEIPFINEVAGKLLKIKLLYLLLQKMAQQFLLTEMMFQIMVQRLELLLENQIT